MWRHKAPIVKIDVGIPARAIAAVELSPTLKHLRLGEWPTTR